MMGNQVGYPTKSCPQLSEGICSQAGPAPELQPWQLHGGAFPPSQWAHAQPGIFQRVGAAKCMIISKLDTGEHEV